MEEAKNKRGTGTVLRQQDEATPITKEKERAELTALEIAEQQDWEVKTLPVWEPGDVILDTYEVENVISGGMGHVYIANHKNWNLKLAIKSPNKTMLENKSNFARILREANSWTELGLHPSIAYCYYVRNIEDVPHIFVEYVDGGNLRQWIEEGKCIDYRTSLDLAIQFCHGMEYAHSKGMIHRDIKPENILMTKDGILKITDFGLVRGGDAESEADKSGRRGSKVEDSSLTVIGAEMGTWGYMSPEQKENPHEVDERTDIFAFGICLYEMFCGNMPYDFASSLPMEPPDPVDLSRDVDFPKDLRKLLIQCVQRDREKRCSDFGDVLVKLKEIYVNLFNKESPYAELERIGLDADGLSNQGVSLWELDRINDARDRFKKAIQKESLHFYSNWNIGKLSVLDQSIAFDYYQKYTMRALDKIFHDSNLPDEEKQDRLEQVLSHNRITDAIAYPFDEHGEEVETVAWSSDGRLLASGAGDSTIRLWRAENLAFFKMLEGHEHIVSSVCFSPDSRYLASGSYDRTVKIWDIQEGRLLATMNQPKDPVQVVKFSPDGARIVSGGDDQTIRWWEVASGKLLKEVETQSGGIVSLDFSLNGRFLASGLDRGEPLIWGLDEAKPIQSGESEEGRNEQFVCFSPDSKSIAVYTGKSFGVFCVEPFEPIAHLVHPLSRPLAMAFSPDGKLLLTTGHDNALMVWRAPDLKLIKIFETDFCINSIAFSPTGEKVVTGDNAGIVRIWRLFLKPALAPPRNYIELKRLKKEKDQVAEKYKKLADEGDLRKACNLTLESWSRDGFNYDSPYYRLFRDLSSRRKGVKYEPRMICELNWRKMQNVGSYAFSQDGKIIGYIQDNNIIKLEDIISKQILTQIECKEEIHDLIFSTKNKLLAAKIDKSVLVWDLKPTSFFKLTNRKAGERFTSKLLGRYEGYDDSRINAMSISPNNRYLAIASSHAILIYNLKKGNLERVLFCLNGDISSVKFSSDGRFIACSENRKDGAIFIGRFDTILNYRYPGQKKEDITFSPNRGNHGQDMRYLIGAKANLNKIAFSPDNRYIAAAVGDYSFSGENVIHLWNVETSKLLHTLEGHSRQVDRIIHTPDGNYVVSGSHDDTVKIWDAQNGRLMKTLGPFNTSIAKLDFSISYHLLSVFDWDGIVRFFFMMPELVFNE